MNKILFRADANPRIGTGDLVSLIHLSVRFANRGWACHFMARDHETSRKLAEQFGVPVMEFLPEAMTVEEEVAFINRYCERHAITHYLTCMNSWTLDNYAGLLPRLKKGCINEDGIVPRDWDLIVNWNWNGHETYNKEAFPKATFLIGPEYVILPANFDSMEAKSREYRHPLKNVLLAMGGADEANLTARVVEKMVEESLDLHLTIILGAGYTGHEALNCALATANFEYVIKQGIPDMYPEYLACDAAIGTGGLTCSELMATHTRSLLVAAVDHQIHRCRFFEERGMAVYLGDWNEFGDRCLGDALQVLESFTADNFSFAFKGANEIFNHFA